ncbi:MAG: hypothetical protein ACPGJE_05645 [Wenzhouxiangellaceae bacterium]
MRFQYTSVHVPSNPLARLGLVLLGITLLAAILFFSIFFLAVAAGLAIIGGIALSIRNWLGGGRKPTRSGKDDALRVEYRVIRREQDGGRD